MNWRVDVLESHFSFFLIFKSIATLSGLYFGAIYLLEFLMLHCVSEKKHYKERKYDS